MSENPKVTIIIPVYKVEKLLDACLTSVVSQTYKNLEIILVDDGSPDNCPSMCDDWAKKDDRIKVYHEENGGQSKARNLALDHMGGDYVLFVDSDDTIEPKMVETLLEASLESGADASVCMMKEDDARPFSGDIYANLLRDELGSQTVRWLFDAHLFRGGLRFPEGRYAEDMMLMDKILYHAKITYVPERFYNYYWTNPTNSSNDPAKRFKNTIDRAIAFSTRFDWMLDKDDIDQETKDIVLSKAVSFCLGTMLRCKKNQRADDDVTYICSFLRRNKRGILHSKFVSRKKKMAFRCFIFSPRLYSAAGQAALKFKYVGK